MAFRSRLSINPFVGAGVPDGPLQMLQIRRKLPKNAGFYRRGVEDAQCQKLKAM